jgi:predicted nucleic acid-binding protein
MIVVADTSPVLYLHQIEQIHLLPSLFGDILVPDYVASVELSAPHTPQAVRHFVESPPQWLKVTATSGRPDERVRHLGEGEAWAMTLALTTQADLLLCDDSQARSVARRIGLRPVGTLGVLELGWVRGLCDVRGSVQRLITETNFRHSPKLIRDFLESLDR